MSSKRRTLGQHMLIDCKVLARIIDAAAIGKNEIVCEAGTGQGILTTELCKYARHVISYEVDENLFKKAQTELLLPFQNLTLINADIFKLRDQLHFDAFVSNLPYSRSRDAIEWLATRKFGRAILMVQKEFAEKLSAKPGDKNYRAISAVSAYCFKIDKLFIVGRQSFKPRPMVDSVVIRLTPVNMITLDIIRNLYLVFSKRNKKASSSTAVKICGIKKSKFENKRIDQLEAQDLIEIAEAMQNIHTG